MASLEPFATQPDQANLMTIEKQNVRFITFRLTKLHYFFFKTNYLSIYICL